MKWDDVVIITLNDISITGWDALRFVEANCQPIAINTTWDGLIRVNTNSPAESTKDQDVRSLLFSKLKDKAESLRFKTGKDFESEILPLARAEWNVFNVNRARLKIEFIYKHDPRSKDKKYLTDPEISVEVAFAGNKHLLASTTTSVTIKGVVDLGVVDTGKYIFTPDYSKLDPCKFDTVKYTLTDHASLEQEKFIKQRKPFYSAELDKLDLQDKQAIYLYPGDDKTVTFEVEPLYQKVQLIAQCLLAIPDRIYQPALKEKIIDNPKYSVEPNQPPKKVVDETDSNLPKDIAVDALKGQWKGKYHGLLDDKADMNARVNLVKATLNYAYTKAKNDPTILKVFMIPECYFQGVYGSYLIEDADHLFTQLLNLVGGVQWRDWVFVFGTVNFTFGEDVREMMNYSPVIRGGLGEATGASGSGGEKDTHLRLLQKLVNSAELLDASELIKKGGERRKPSVNDAVQFQATQNEEEVGIILSRLFDETSYKEAEDKTDLEFGKSKGLDSGQWKQLQEELKKDVKALGLTRVVRSIRLCNIQKTSDTLSDWVYSGFKDKKTAHLSSNQVFLIKDNPFQKIFDTSIKQEWESYWREMLKPEVRFKPPLTKLNWNKPSDIMGSNVPLCFSLNLLIHPV